MPVEIPLEKWTGKIHQVKLGGNGRKSVIVGGQTTLPFLHFDGAIPNRPVVAVEVFDCEPSDWSPTLTSAWGNVIKDPALWAKKAVEYGAELIQLTLRSAHPDEGNTSAVQARISSEKVLAAVDVPIIITGPGVAEKDNEILVACSEVARGQRIALGNCLEKNYRTLAAVCIADGHVVIGTSPVDLNLAKQLNILLSDTGIPLDSILMDPTTGTLGYGLEYTYSVMERLRLAALGGDKMTAMPMINQIGAESWRQKEAKVSHGLPISWGEMKQRGLMWEEQTAISLLAAGSDILVLRHPANVGLVKATIDNLMGK